MGSLEQAVPGVPETNEHGAEAQKTKTHTNGDSPAGDPYAAHPVEREYYIRPAKPLPEDPVLCERIQQVLKDGYVLIPNALTQEETRWALDETERLLEESPKYGHDHFTGFKTSRLYGILGKTRSFDSLITVDAVQKLNDYFLDPEWLMWALVSISIHPGERAQTLHHDDAFCHQPRPREPVTATSMIALDDFTDKNGATRLIPGSHKWGGDRIGEEHECIDVVCPKGSVLYFLGTLWHSGGANRSDKKRVGVTVHYCQPFIRPLENQLMVVDPRRILRGEIPERVVQLMGYQCGVAPFFGQSKCMMNRHITRVLACFFELLHDLDPRKSHGKLTHYSLGDSLKPRQAAKRMVHWFGEPTQTHMPAHPGKWD